LRYIAKDNKVVVSGVNTFKKHVKGDGRNKKSEIIDIVKPVAASSLMLLCPSCQKPTRVGFKEEAGITVRVCKKCKKTIENVKNVVKEKKEDTKSKKEIKKEVKKKD
jgi:large subunit ribosomal protein L24